MKHKTISQRMSTAQGWFVVVLLVGILLAVWAEWIRFGNASAPSNSTAPKTASSSTSWA